MSAPKRKPIEWLMGELPELTRQGVLDYEAGERLRRHYTAQLDMPQDRRWVTLLFAVVGALLAGSGLILIIAHNWVWLGREARTCLALAPVLIGEAFAAFTLLRRKESAPWREGSALFLALAGGTALALVSQTYQWDRDLTSFLGIWGCMALGVVYLLGSSAAAVLAAGIFCWWGFVLDHGVRTAALLHWAGLAALIPHAVSVWRDRPDGGRLRLLAFTLPGIGALALLPAQPHYSGLWIPLWLGYAATLWHLDVAVLRGRVRPVMFLACALFVVLGLVLGFRDAWRNADRAAMFDDGPAVLFMFAWLAASIALGVRNFVRGSDGLDLVAVGAAPFTLVLMLAGHSLGERHLAPVLANLSLFAFGVMIVRRGIRASSLRTANLGMGVIVAQALLRFFDTDWSFVGRGAVFLAVGAGFLLVNWRIAHNASHPAKEGSA